VAGAVIEASRQLLTGVPTPADSADTLRDVQAQLGEITTRVKVLEEILTQWPELVARSADTDADRTPTDADRNADRVPPAADTGRGQPGGQRKLTPRQQRALRDKRQRGVPVEALMEEYGLSRASVFRYLRSPQRGR